MKLRRKIPLILVLIIFLAASHELLPNHSHIDHCEQHHNPRAQKNQCHNDDYCISCLLNSQSFYQQNYDKNTEIIQLFIIASKPLTVRLNHNPIFFHKFQINTGFKNDYLNSPLFNKAPPIII
mgnify:FL=1